MQATDAALLAADEPAPVRVLRPEARSPFFLTADHAGRLIPARLGTLGLDETERVRHTAWDIGIAGVTERLSEALDATAVLQPCSRLRIDCNRDPTATDSIPEVSEATAIPGNRALSAAERKARREAIFDLYHGAIAALLDRRRMAAQTTVRRELAYVEIEIRQDLITGEAGQAEWAARLARLLPEAMGRLEEEDAGPRGRN